MSNLETDCFFIYILTGIWYNKNMKGGKMAKKRKKLIKNQKWSRADIFGLISLILGIIQTLISLFKK